MLEDAVRQHEYNLSMHHLTPPKVHSKYLMVLPMMFEIVQEVGVGAVGVKISEVEGAGCSSQEH